ncbi:MAG TPA: isocitrate lyase/phosphoenolpyruvate mutase family protein [Acetobacteraceae bacterium]|jgi:2-methylisocitrate lyase-like PEP mutase family enzyme|nr:isocitrate lyase/phosphoenolpyruvate mutase family protein [Acetobacteraceae bacterium]
MKQQAAYERFRALHETGCFLMPNAWDGTSSVLLKAAGFQALGTSSAAIAFGLGRADGAHAVSLADSVANGTLMAVLTGLPVNGDLEDGYGPSPDDCAMTVRAAIAGGLAGLGIEDTTADPASPIHGFDAAVARVRRAAAEAKGRILLTGRTDNFLHGRADLEDTIRRLVAFAEAGADVLYAPGLPDMAAILAVVRAVAPKPVNVLLGPRSGMVTMTELASAGVRRVSLGGALYRVAMRQIDTAAKALAAGDIAAAVTSALPSSAFTGFFPEA